MFRTHSGWCKPAHVALDFSVKPSLEELEGRYQPSTFTGAQLNAFADQVFNDAAFQAAVVQQTENDIGFAINNEFNGGPFDQFALNQQVANDLFFEFQGQNNLQDEFGNYVGVGQNLNDQGFLDLEDQADFSNNAFALFQEVSGLAVAQQNDFIIASDFGLI